MNKNNNELEYWRPVATKILGVMSILCLVITVALITEATGLDGSESISLLSKAKT